MHSPWRKTNLFFFASTSVSKMIYHGLNPVVHLLQNTLWQYLIITMLQSKKSYLGCELFVLAIELQNQDFHPIEAELS